MSAGTPDLTEQSMLAEARAEVELADHKASLVMTALGIGFGAVLGGLLAGDWKPSQYHSPGEFIWWMAATVGTSALICSAIAVWPRYSVADLSQGIFYWGHVATFGSLSDLSDALNNQSTTEIDRTRHQLYQLSRIVNRKYNLVRASFVLTALAGSLFLLAALSGS